MTINRVIPIADTHVNNDGDVVLATVKRKTKLTTREARRLGNELIAAAANAQQWATEQTDTTKASA